MKLPITAAVAAALASATIAAPSPAEARSSFGVYVGSDSYYYGSDYGYRYRCDDYRYRRAYPRRCGYRYDYDDDYDDYYYPGSYYYNDSRYPSFGFSTRGDGRHGYRNRWGRDRHYDRGRRGHRGRH